MIILSFINIMLEFSYFFNLLIILNFLFLFCTAFINMQLNYERFWRKHKLITLLIKTERIEIATKLIFAIQKYQHISHKLTEANWLNMISRQFFNIACFLFKIISSKKPPYLLSKIEYRTKVHILNTHFRGLLSPSQHNFICLASYYLNSLPFSWRPLRGLDFQAQRWTGIRQLIYFYFIISLRHCNIMYFYLLLKIFNLFIVLKRPN